MDSHDSDSLFISHSHRDALLVEAVSSAVGKVFGNRLNVRNSSSKRLGDAPETGEDYFQWIVRSAEESKVTFVLLTPASAASQWLLWEAGLVFGTSRTSGRNGNGTDLRPLTFQLSSKEVPSVFTSARLQRARIDEPQGIKNVLTQLVTDYHASFKKQELGTAYQSIPTVVDEYMKKVDALLSKKPILEQSHLRLTKASREVRENVRAVSDNVYFEQLLSDTFEQWTDQLEEVEPNSAAFRLPYVLYPEYLLRLMKAKRPTLKAIALVGHEETFWREKVADEIRLNTTPTSTRVFVFRTPEHLREHVSILRQHARCYNVRAMAYDQLVRDFGSHVYDFSLLGEIDARLLARYEQVDLSKWIRFSTDAKEISAHEDEINRMIVESVEVDKPVQASDTELSEIDDRLIDLVFAQGKSTYQRMPVEMSAYINLNEYDLHEEQHAYYVEMMDRMIAICEAARANGARPTTILEMGAGTGLFTKRLMALEDVDIVAVEIDWACYLRLAHLGKHAKAKLTCRQADSRSYDPGGPSKRFAFVMSSFADHHIKPYDKARYFANVKRNMEPGALFIVGDEFLPPHDERDVEARREALRTYHGHIIGIAQSKGQAELAALETEAMNSGLSEIGDFKLTCKEYESKIKAAGFTVESKVLIGPTDTPDVGGVYVYTMRLPR
jgi:hypothetical protein